MSARSPMGGAQLIYRRRTCGGDPRSLQRCSAGAAAAGGGANCSRRRGCHCPAHARAFLLPAHIFRLPPRACLLESWELAGERGAVVPVRIRIERELTPQQSADSQPVNSQQPAQTAAAGSCRCGLATKGQQLHKGPSVGLRALCVDQHELFTDPRVPCSRLAQRNG